MNRSFYRRLYSIIPDFRCPKPGCIDCCLVNMPPCHPWEERRIRRYVHKRRIRLEPGPPTACPFLGARGCLIHPVRPMVCRLFGATSPTLLCPHWGTTPDRGLMTRELWDYIVKYAFYSKDHAVLLTRDGDQSILATMNYLEVVQRGRPD